MNCLIVVAVVVFLFWALSRKTGSSAGKRTQPPHGLRAPNTPPITDSQRRASYLANTIMQALDNHLARKTTQSYSKMMTEFFHLYHTINQFLSTLGPQDTAPIFRRLHNLNQLVFGIQYDALMPTQPEEIEGSNMDTIMDRLETFWMPLFSKANSRSISPERFAEQNFRQ